MRGRVSVAMVTFNGADYVREQLESILAQDPPPDELVIGDDGSTDGTVDLLREATRDSQVTVVVVGGDHVGLRLNVQRTIEACTGDVIALADQDDVWLQEKIAAIREAFRDPSVTLWFSDAELIDEAGRIIGERLWERVNLIPAQLTDLGNAESLRRLLIGQTVTGATMAFRGTLKSLILPLPKELEIGDHLYLHDGWIAVLAWMMGRAVADPAAMIRYRRHPLQLTARTEPEIEAITDSEKMRCDAVLDRPSESRRLASPQELAREHARARLVLERIRAADSLGACRPQDLAMLVRFERFLRLRAMSPGLARAAAVIQQFALGRYSQYARGWRTAAADLFLTRG